MPFSTTGTVRSSCAVFCKRRGGASDAEAAVLEAVLSLVGLPDNAPFDPSSFPWLSFMRPRLASLTAFEGSENTVFGRSFVIDDLHGGPCTFTGDALERASDHADAVLESVG